MCPDRDLVSAYVDGEMPSPWAERLEEHLRSCPDCAALAVGYSALGERLRSELSGGEAEAFERGRLRFEALLASRPAATAERVPFRRSVSLPLPLAVAAAFLVVLLGGATTLLALRPSKSAAIQSVASGEIIPALPASASQPASMDELLRYLDARDGQVTLTINLPSGTTFGSAGKPVIMRSGQVVNGTPVGGSSP